VTLRNRDCEGEQVNVQKKSKKLCLQAGQEESIEPAMARFSLRSLTCPGVQQTLLADQTSPHRETSSDRNASEGYTLLIYLYGTYLFCFSIIGTGELLPKYVQGTALHHQRLARGGKDTCPRIEHKPSLCSSVAEVGIKEAVRMSVVRCSGHRGLRMIMAVGGSC